MDARRWWWLRLCAWQWVNHCRSRPLRALATPVAGFLLCVLLPLTLAISDPRAARAARAALLSVDVPLAIALAALTAAAVLAWRNNPSPAGWLVPPGSRAASRLRGVQLVGTARWSTAFVIAALLLTARQAPDSGTVELLLIAVLGLGLGALLGWLFTNARQDSSATAATWTTRLDGPLALSWVPLQGLLGQLNLRRLSLFSLPVLLAAPMGAAAQQVLGNLLVYLPGFALLVLLQKAALTSQELRRWVPASPHRYRLQWWAWRLVLAALALCAATLALHTWREPPMGVE